ncbi:MAG: substrate-binding domain-containing protein [Chitinivibrionales bacterium]|nr:substrate-binding domain-containing protein [Chitinivibrionales bacterium]
MRKSFPVSAISVFFAALAAFAVITCTQDKTTTIAVIPKGTSHIFWKSVHAGAKKAGQEKQIDIIWQGPQKEDDRSMQIEVVQNFISRGVDALVLAPLDAAALVRPVEAAIKRDIKVVIIDSDLNSGAYASFVATDNFAGGKIGAKRLAEFLPDGAGNVLMMRYNEGSASTTKREEGFLEGLREYAPQATVVSSDQYGGVTIESSLQAGQNLLNKFEELDGIFCPNESTTQGMLRALETAGKSGQIRFVGFDSSEPLLKGLKEEKIHGLVVQNPFKMGYLGVATAVAAINGEKVDKRVDTGVMLITPDNIDQPEAQQVISPDIEKWLGK